MEKNTIQDVYNAIEEMAEGFYSEKRSRFLSFVLPVQSTEEVKEVVGRFRKQYHDARHVCWAYSLGAEGEYRVWDDGEPSSTAGKPILGQIRAAGVSDVIVIVVRYFGGVELGTGGLTAAYRRAAADVLTKAKPILRTVDTELALSCAYEDLDRVLKVIRESGAKVQECITDIRCCIRLTVRINHKDALQKRLETLRSVNFTPQP
ncbi:MAG: YigZ family protein [Tannerellaceae bacterium]|nr:YigZ family protein [Tannerellaceae bacterium]